MYIRTCLNPSRNRKLNIKLIKRVSQTGVKPKASDYFSKVEIATLFLQPMAFILLYFGITWKTFQYTCNVSNLSEFSNSLLWLNGRGPPPRHYISDKPN